MYIEIEGKTYYISIRDSEKKVTVIGQKDGTVQLAVAAQLSEGELITYLKSTSFQKSIKSEQPSKLEAAATIAMFDTTFTLIIQKELLTPYIAGKSLYTNLNPKSKAAQNSLLEQILMQELKQQIGFWEEKLGVLIDNINIRKLKTNFHTVCSNSSRLTFDKNLIYRSREFLAYLCAVAVFDYIQMEESIREQLANQYIKDWKHHQKVFLYELTQHVNR
ncbi:YgjP-like metallopeptidase domain-containing protein [Sphingobacterium yanglingense]|uniref:Putative metal-dependent hydrolase n=1 Tax=Sphingobacterium yanglingense TaxID=1437280 RepID=A0A4V3DE54_9SPHI|nr:YgjP-like metallopeptidase domain-containing protein [Sphingobacterium yanglingense]TDQ79859.1 putative metal-dependent hydrolase [Sphingobacterium yanglingense]